MKEDTAGRGVAERSARKLLVIALAFATALAAAGDSHDLVGEDLSAWRGDTGTWFVAGTASLAAADPKRLVTGAGAGVLVNGPEGVTSDLLSVLEHGDAEVHVEFMVPKGSNSGVYLQGRYEVQIFDSWGVEEPGFGDCGGIYQRWSEGEGFEGHPPRENASRPPGEWQSLDIVFQAPRFDAAGRKTALARFVRVVHNGVVVHEDVEVTGPTRAATFDDEKPLGSLMLQGDHGPVAYRNVEVRAWSPPGR